MQMKEVQQKLDISRRALQHYEEKGLLKVKRDENGYRNYSQEDIERLRKISVYRKLNIAISEIKGLLDHEDKTLLEKILEEKKKQQKENAQEIEALAMYLQNADIASIDEQLRYQTLALRFKEMLPGMLGDYFMTHFQPYLQIHHINEEQERAYHTIMDFFDQVDLSIPLFIRFSCFVTRMINGKQQQHAIDHLHQESVRLSGLDGQAYEQEKEKIRKAVRIQQTLLYRYHPAMIAKRKFMKALQDCGYNDILIPNMKILSPLYRSYHDALQQVNDRICADLGLYYDSKYRLVMKK